MEQCSQCPIAQYKSNPRDVDKLKTISVEITESDNNLDRFDCNICLDSVQDPVVTFCGHLYCWPCIYKWLQSENSAPQDQDHLAKCPVCKTEVSQNSLIPLYGRGKSGKLSDSKGIHPRPAIPHRPNGKLVHPLVEGPSRSPYSYHPQHLHNRDGYPPHQEIHAGHLDSSLGRYSRASAVGFAGTTTFYPVIDMFGNMIYSRFLGNSETAFYKCPTNTYSAGSTSSARGRRHVMQAERSLSRASLFLFCCLILCLILF